MSSAAPTISDKRRAYLDNKIRVGLVNAGKHGTSQDVVKFYNSNGKDYNEVG